MRAAFHGAEPVQGFQTSHTFPTKSGPGFNVT
jgi:hypothetical protein